MKNYLKKKDKVMKRKFRTLEEWKKHLLRDKTKEYEKYKRKNNILPMPRGTTSETVIEGELIKEK